MKLSRNEKQVGTVGTVGCSLAKPFHMNDFLRQRPQELVGIGWGLGGDRVGTRLDSLIQIERQVGTGWSQTCLPQLIDSMTCRCSLLCGGDQWGLSEAQKPSYFNRLQGRTTSVPTVPTKKQVMWS